MANVRLVRARRKRVRRNMAGTSDKPRLSVFRSNMYIYAQLIDDQNSKTLSAVSDKKLPKEGIAKRFDEYKNNVIPAMNYFKDKKDYTIYTINGEQSVEDVHKDIINKLGYRL
ncbi:50S ribosomal protein L18 [Candidatus Nomurabacteria bacterium CG_4_9_14_0_2_um_filter_32_10]|uniref:50S ribosomal protein L18 n=1 Tax=Candidatus Nomurabacteria bacterium CG_4_9_14_0_2_um_filter_32_10 TaxID=1974729 RepID=A0A2J0N444_9BACT|nr:MAG: 50S ribosomal protein L18 [Candidatus Nomurabacteria bacterium CG_4_9_14_0_2_um_filter_32_10]